MLRLSNVRKDYGDRTLFKEVNLFLTQNHRVALIGPNGSGKTTLAKIAAGMIEPDSGSSTHVGNPIIETVWQEADAKSWGDLVDGDESALGLACVQLLRACGMEFPHAATSLETLSGGEVMRLRLARALASCADLIILDEPTNNLDEDSIDWLVESVKSSTAAFLIISHDRTFLDAVTETTWAIDQLKCSVEEYGGSYTQYRNYKQSRLENHWRLYREQERRARKLEEDVRETKRRARAVENTTVNDFRRGRAKKVAALAKSRERRMMRLVDSERRLDKPRENERARLALSARDLHGKIIVELSALSAGYAGCLVATIGDITLRSGDRVAITGKNGAGKTTIIKTITGEIPPLAGEIKRKPGLTVQMLEQARVCGPDKMPVLTWFFEQIARLPNSDQGFFDHSTARTFLHRFLFKGDDVFKQIGHLSAGERARLCFASIMASKPDLLILDEPTNNLDISLIECLEDALNEYSGALIVASHDRYFREKIGVQSLWAIEGKRLAVRAE